MLLSVHDCRFDALPFGHIIKRLSPIHTMEKKEDPLRRGQQGYLRDESDPFVELRTDIR